METLHKQNVLTAALVCAMALTSATGTQAVRFAEADFGDRWQRSSCESNLGEIIAVVKLECAPGGGRGHDAFMCGRSHDKPFSIRSRDNGEL
jgi:hypothetical protein